MAEKDRKPNEPEPVRRSDTPTTILMMGAALAAVAGFGVLFSLWWRTEVDDSYEVLRIASQQFVSGRPIVAGELAETVEFQEEPDVLDGQVTEADLVAEDSEQESPELKAAKAARKDRIEWIRLRDFLVGAGKVAHRGRRRHSPASPVFACSGSVFGSGASRWFSVGTTNRGTSYAW